MEYQELRESLAELASNSEHSIVAANELDYAFSLYVALLGLRGGLLHWANNKKLFQLIYNPYGCYDAEHLQQFDVKSPFFDFTSLDVLDQQVQSLLASQPKGLTAERIAEIARGFEYNLRDSSKSVPVFLTQEERKTRHETKAHFWVETYTPGIHRLRLYIVPGEYLNDSGRLDQTEFLLTRIVHTEEDVRRLLAAHQMILAATRLAEVSCASAYPGPRT